MQTSRRPFKYQNMLILSFFMKLLQIIASTLKWLTGVGKSLNNNTTNKDTNNDNADPATPPATPAPVPPKMPVAPKAPVKPAVPINPHTTPKTPVSPKTPGTQGNPGGGDLNTRIEQDNCPNRQTWASSGFPH